MHFAITGHTALIAGVTNGLDVMTCSRAVGLQGLVIGVEPQPSSLVRARSNIELNVLPPNIRLVSAALGDMEGFIKIGAAPRENAGWSSIVLREHGELPYDIRIVPVATLLADLGVPSIDLMLLDLEGYELQALKGLQGGPLPTVLILEVHPKVLELTQTDPTEYYGAVEALGYRCFDLSGRCAGPGHKLPESNLICLRESARVIWV
jgi:FkbM family methyltransferase